MAGIGVVAQWCSDFVGVGMAVGIVVGTGVVGLG